MAALVKSRCRTYSGLKAAARDWLLSACSSQIAVNRNRVFMVGRIRARR